MCADHEKLTETVGIKLSEKHVRQVRGVAESLGMESSGWIRSIILEALSEKAREYAALHSIFGDMETETKNNGGKP